MSKCKFRGLLALLLAVCVIFGDASSAIASNVAETAEVEAIAAENEAAKVTAESGEEDKAPETETSAEETTETEETEQEEFCIVSFLPEGGSGQMSDQRIEGSAAISKNQFTRTGYQFAGWKAEDALGRWFDGDGWSSNAADAYVLADEASLMIPGSMDGSTIRLHAQWTVNTFRVVYDANGGKGTMSEQTITYGQATALNSCTFTKAESHFIGWRAYRSSDAKWYTTEGWKSDEEITANGYTYAVYPDGAMLAKTSAVNKDTITLKAQWGTNSFTVVYDANGGSGSMKAQKIVYGQATALKNCTFYKTGYHFTGWRAYRSSDAKWYTTNGWKTTAEISAGGYTYAIYPDGASLAKTSSVHNDTVTLKAQWSINKFTVVYNANGGSGSMKNTTVTYGQDTALSACAFSKTGYHFAGWTAYRKSDNTWYTTEGWKTAEEIQSKDYTYAVYKDKSLVAKTSAVQNDTITLYAKWNANTFTVVYDANGGSGTMASQTITYGKETALRSCTYKKASYHFTGWRAYRSSDKTWYTTAGWKTASEIQANGYRYAVYPDGAVLAKTSAVNKDTITMKAQWGINTFTVVYDANGGSGSMKNTVVTYGTEKNLATCAFTNTGYHFVGWKAYRSSDQKWYTTAGWKTAAEIQANGYQYDLYPENAAVARSSAVFHDTITMKAQWKINTFKVVYDANGGSGSMAGQTITYGKETALLKNAFTKKDCYFGGWAAYRSSDRKWYTTAGWKTAAEMTAGGYSYKLYPDGSVIAKTTDVFNDTITMKAQWKNNAFTVVYRANGGSGSMENTLVKIGIATPLRKNAFSNSGKSFLGWYAYRKSDGKWYTLRHGWQTADAIAKNHYVKSLYTDGQSIARTSELHGDTIEMQAQWGPKKFTLHFDANGGSGSMADQDIVYGTATAIRKNAFTKADSALRGWSAYRESDGKWLTVEAGWQTSSVISAKGYTKDVYADGQEIAKTSSVHQDYITMKANWMSVGSWSRIDGVWTFVGRNGIFKSNGMHEAWETIRNTSSKTSYFLVVDTSRCETYVFTGRAGAWEPYMKFLCSPGKPSTPTVKGTFEVESKGYCFHGANKASPTYTCYYYTGFHGNYLFHSVIYRYNTFQISDGRLGMQLSHGCVRLALENAKWIYNNVPMYSKVRIY